MAAGLSWSLKVVHNFTEPYKIEAMPAGPQERKIETDY